MASWNKPAYHTRLFLWLIGYSVLLVGCFVAYQYQREKDFKIKELDSQMQLINARILSELSEGDSLTAPRIRDMHPFEELRVSVITPGGRVIYDNMLDSVPGSNHLNREEVRQAIKNGSGYAVRRYSESTGQTYFYSARRGHDGIVIRTAVPYSVTLSELLRADYGFIWLMGGVAVVMCVFGFLATRRVGQHISRLNRFAENAEKGIHISDSEPFPHDELGNISHHIIRLYARLQQAMNDRDREHRAALREQSEKERIKKQLTENINHELKTPVAAIQVCLETLADHPGLSENKRKEFLQRSLDNTARLRRLLEDIAMITRMTEGGYAIPKNEVDLSEIISETIAECRAAAEAKGIMMATAIPERMMMTGNRGLLVSVFQNLIDNSIAYSGGTSIDIRLESDSGRKRVISVSDNGCGVAEEHLPHLFERFYRVDKGRSRAAGGTGLGLSIVKNAVLFHGGTITVSRRPGGGLTFTLTFRSDGLTEC